MHCYKKKQNWPVIIVIAVLCICNLVLYLNTQEKKRMIISQQIVIDKLEQTAQKAITDLTDSNEHVRAYELRIAQLEEALAYYQ